MTTITKTSVGKNVDIEVFTEIRANKPGGGRIRPPPPTPLPGKFLIIQKTFCGYNNFFQA